MDIIMDTATDMTTIMIMNLVINTVIAMGILKQMNEEVLPTASHRPSLPPMRQHRTYLLQAVRIEALMTKPDPQPPWMNPLPPAVNPRKSPLNQMSAKSPTWRAGPDITSIDTMD